MNSTNLIALISALIALSAVSVSYYTFRKMLHAAARPTLVFSMTSGYECVLENIGTGATINLVVSELDHASQIVSATKCHPLSPGKHLIVSWVMPTNDLVATYTDVYRNAFTTIHRGDQNEVFNKNLFPDLTVTHDQWVQRLLAEGRGRSNLKEQDLDNKTPEQLDILRNEIYARKGYIFKRPDLAEYFGRQPWYHPVTGDHRVAFHQFSESEKYNVFFILEYQNRKGLRTKGSIDHSLKAPMLRTGSHAP